MVDSIKNLTTPPQSSSGSSADALRKNFKAISSSSVTAQGGGADPSAIAARAVASVTDAVQLSAEALRSLGKGSEAVEPKNQQIADANIDSATASPEDLAKVKKEADRTGVAIQFRPAEALFAHGDGVSFEQVTRLLAD